MLHLNNRNQQFFHYSFPIHLSRKAILYLNGSKSLSAEAVDGEADSAYVHCSSVTMPVAGAGFLGNTVGWDCFDVIMSNGKNQASVDFCFAKLPSYATK